MEKATIRLEYSIVPIWMPVLLWFHSTKLSGSIPSYRLHLQIQSYRTFLIGWIGLSLRIQRG